MNPSASRGDLPYAANDGALNASSSSPRRYRFPFDHDDEDSSHSLMSYDGRPVDSAFLRRIHIVRLPKHSVTSEEMTFRLRQNYLFIFNLLDDINKRIADKKKVHSHPNDDFLSVAEIQKIAEGHIKIEDLDLSHNAQRMLHFILYLNTEIENCSWVIKEPLLSLSKYVHGKPISRNTYYKLVDVLNLKSLAEEIIMFTPYSFCRDLVDITLNKIKAMDGFSQLTASENLIISLMKTVKNGPVGRNAINPLTSHFNQGMLVFGKDYLPYDIRRLDFEDEEKEISKYNGYRVKSIFTILIEVIKYQPGFNSKSINPLYKLDYLRSLDKSGNFIFKELFDLIIYKCMNMCNFSIDTWLSWYEIEVVELDTNLQSAIGNLCFELCSFMDEGFVADDILKEFRPILHNIAIEKINFRNVDISDIDRMIDRVNNSSKFHLSAWIKKLIENTQVFTHPRAIQSIDDSMENIDFNCFKYVVDNCMTHCRSGGLVLDSMGFAIYKGMAHLDMEDKLLLLRNIIVNHAENQFYFSKNFENTLHYVAANELNEDIDQKEVMTKLIWLVMQQPQKIFHLLIQQYVRGICGLRTKSVDARKSCLHKVLVEMHLNMDPKHIYQEYTSWLSFDLKLSSIQKQNLQKWIIETRTLRLIKPTNFLSNVLVPLLNPSSNYKHTVFLITILQTFFIQLQSMPLPGIDLWDKILVQLAVLLDDARWTIENHLPSRVKLCEALISIIPSILLYASFIIKPDSVDILKRKLSTLHLMTRAHFLRLWTADYITVEGMDEHFIMTIHSNSHISYSNLNSSSTQLCQEEFIFSIATYMPKFTLREMKSFVGNYLSSAKIENIFEASFFLLDCVMSAFMRIIVYLKTAIQKSSNDEGSWDYVTCTIINFLDAINTSKMCSIYDAEVNVNMAVEGIAKVVMVVKQLENDRQMPLLVFIRRLVNSFKRSLDEESTSKLVSLLLSIKSTNSSIVLGNTVGILANSIDST